MAAGAEEHKWLPHYSQRAVKKERLEIQTESTDTYLLWELNLKMHTQGFPGGAVVKNPPANAGDAGSIPDPGRSHMPWSNYTCAPQLLNLCPRARVPQLLSPCATTTEARVPKAHAPQEKPPQ